MNTPALNPRAAPADVVTHSDMPPRLPAGLLFEEMPLGFAWSTAGRTVTDADVGAYVNLTWFTEELFTNHHDRSGQAISGKPVPAALVFAMAEGLVLPSLNGTGLAFLHNEMDVKRPLQVGETIYVQCDVIEARATSNPARGLVRTRNVVRNSSGEQVLVYKPLRLIRRKSL